MQWVSNLVKVVGADEEACITVTESQVDMHGSLMKCLIRRDLTEYDYVSMGKDGFIPISIKPMKSMTRLSNNNV
jgi:hypothetical protein